MVVVSVKHTGTRFLMHSLGIENYVHTDREWERLLASLPCRDIVSPVRDPAKTWDSWCKRMGSVPTSKRLFMFKHSYVMLDRLARELDVDFISIDRQEDSRIDCWDKIGHDDVSCKNYLVPEVDLSDIYMLPMIKNIARGDLCQ